MSRERGRRPRPFGAGIFALGAILVLLAAGRHLARPCSPA